MNPDAHTVCLFTSCACCRVLSFDFSEAAQGGADGLKTKVIQLMCLSVMFTRKRDGDGPKLRLSQQTTARDVCEAQRSEVYPHESLLHIVLLLVQGERAPLR